MLEEIKRKVIDKTTHKVVGEVHLQPSDECYGWRYDEFGDIVGEGRSVPDITVTIGNTVEEFDDEDRMRWFLDENNLILEDEWELGPNTLQDRLDMYNESQQMLDDMSYEHRSGLWKYNAMKAYSASDEEAIELIRTFKYPEPEIKPRNPNEGLSWEECFDMIDNGLAKLRFNNVICELVLNKYDKEVIIAFGPGTYSENINRALQPSETVEVRYLEQVYKYVTTSQLVDIICEIYGKDYITFHFEDGCWYMIFSKEKCLEYDDKVTNLSELTGRCVKLATDTCIGLSLNQITEIGGNLDEK